MDSNGTIIINNEFVAVCTEEYDSLKRNDLILDALMTTLFINASLSWDKKSLRFDDEIICHVLQALCTHDYNFKLRSLQQKEEINGTDKD